MAHRWVCYEMAHRRMCYEMAQRRMCYEMAHIWMCYRMTQRRMCYEMAHRRMCYEMAHRRMCYEMAHTCSQHFFHAYAVAGDHEPPPQRPRPAAGRGSHHPLTLSDHSGPRGSGAHFPGGGGGTGSNSLPRTIRIAVWEIFSGGLRDLGNFFTDSHWESVRSGKFFPGAFALQENNFGPKDSDSSRESAAAPPVRDSPKFFSPTILFLIEFFSKYSRVPAQKRKKCEKIHSHSHNKIIVPLIVWVIVWGLTHSKSTP